MNNENENKIDEIKEKKTRVRISPEEKQRRINESLDLFNNLYNRDIRQKEAEYLGIILSNKINRNDPRLINCISQEDFELLGESSQVLLCGYVTYIGLQKNKKGKYYGLIFITDDNFNDYEIITTQKTLEEIKDIRVPNICTGDLVKFLASKSDGTKLFLVQKNIFKIEGEVDV